MSADMMLGRRNWSAIGAMLRPYRGRVVDPIRRVRVYKNTARIPAVWSVMQDGLVVAHADALMLTDVRFVVSAAGLARMRREGHRVVCAFAEGLLASDALGMTPADSARRLRFRFPIAVDFSPEAGAFVIRKPAIRQGAIVRTALFACLHDAGVNAAYVRRRV